MAKTKKKQEKRAAAGPDSIRAGIGDNAASAPSCPAERTSPSGEEAAEGTVVGCAEQGGDAPRETGGEATHPAVPMASAFPQSRWRRWMPDLAKFALAWAFIGVAAAIWYMPPLIRADFPFVSYAFRGQTANDAALYRPLAMPTRYYIALPRKLAGRYEWFAVDRRREVAALTEAPRHRFLGRHAIKRSDPMGLDLEFRKLDGSEWQIHFFEDSIVFSNALLTVRMDTKEHASR